MITVGHFGRAFGVWGWIRVQSFTQPKENIFDYSPWYHRRTDGTWQPILVEETHIAQSMVKIHGYDSPESHLHLRGQGIHITPEQLPKMDAGYCYQNEIVGCEVFNQQQYNLGEVMDISSESTQGLMVIVPTSRSIDAHKRLIPLVPDAIVRCIDPTQRRVEVTWDADYLTTSL